jgi:hypothetical protein
MLGYCEGYRDQNSLIINIEIPDDSINNINRKNLINITKAIYKTNKVKIIKIEDLNGNEYDSAICNFGYDYKSKKKITSCSKNEIIINNYKNTYKNSIGIKFYLEKELLINILKYQTGIINYIQNYNSDGESIDVSPTIDLNLLDYVEINSDTLTPVQSVTSENFKFDNDDNVVHKNFNEFINILEEYKQNLPIDNNNKENDDDTKLNSYTIYESLQKVEEIKLLEENSQNSNKIKLIDNEFKISNTNLRDKQFLNNKNLQYIFGISIFAGIVVLLYKRYK